MPMTRGMESTVYVIPTSRADPARISVSAWNLFTMTSPSSGCCPAVVFPTPCMSKGTNFCDIGWQVDPGSGRLILMSAIDNLVKGAPGRPCRT
jgi:N-acetyl-gamma-glutamyl-phosphate reductase